ncbi:NADH:flavin oxidoreductase, partial [Chloroflexota bacterium]
MKLFESGLIGKMEVRNRIVMAPLGLNLTKYPYTFSRHYVDVLEERARGGVGLVLTCHVKAESTIDPYPIRRMQAALDKGYGLGVFSLLTERVHRHGAKIAVQICAGSGACADAPSRENWPAAPSPVPILAAPHLFTRE